MPGLPLRLTGACLVALLSLAVGCGSSPDAPGGCSTTADCAADHDCVDLVCVARPDAGVTDAGGRDAGTPCPAARVCGEACCETTERCGRGNRCCAAEDLCGGACCDGDGRVCVADVCVLDCGDDAPCGDGMVCCGGGEVCLLDECVEPGDACDGSLDCPAGEYCEASVGRCLPRATDGPECEYRPETGAFELEEEWHWSGDPDVMPLHDQVMSAPMVANLNDDDGDGRIDQDDIPDVVFNTFRTRSPDTGGAAAYSADGVLRAVSGHDGSRLWPTESPAFRTQPGLEVAIADLDPASPGPEIVGCTFDAGTTFGTPRLTIFSAAGAILRRFDAGDVIVGCGRPSVADMNGDGVAEIVVGNTIVQADGSGVVTAPLMGTSAIPVLYDVDEDPDLELVGINGVANHDGTIVWQEALFTGESGYAAVADLDLDGDPDVVATSVQSHMVTVRDAGSGMLLAGPVEVTPVEDPEIRARVDAIMAARPDRDALTGGGPPTIANFDEDREPEFALAGGYAYVIFEHDATRKWYEITQDTSSRATGSSVFDFEGDGVAEVLYNDEYVFRAFRGPTGEVYLERCNTSGTLTEYPIVVDVDNDDHAEIVLVENNYSRSLCADGVTPSATGVYAFGHPDNQWVRTRRIWNQHAYHVTNVNEDGTLPLREAPNHLNPRLNNFRQNVQPDGLFDAPDLVLSDLAASTAACSAALLLRVRVVNAGRAGAPAGVPVSFYVDGAFVARVTTTRPLLAGASEVVEVRFDAVAGVTYEVSAVLNDPAHEPLGGLNECRTDNNDADPITAGCPDIG